MAIRVVVELRAKPGRRDEFKDCAETIVAELVPSLQEKGWSGSTSYEGLDDPDVLVEIADGASVEAHDAALADPGFHEAMAPGFELLDGPFTAKVLEVP